MKNLLGIIVLSFGSGVFGAYFYSTSIEKPKESFSLTSFSAQDQDSKLIDNRTDLVINSLPDDDRFIKASINGTSSVVYIKNISSRSYRTSFYDWYFGDRGRNIETVSSGSGVILSSNGYIVTNNHVVSGADKIEVVHERNTYIAELVGTDPSSDLAVIKIDGKNLPAIKTGVSRDVKVGQWVLAIGNPFNLTSTVTAGIVSAKGRDLNILEDKFPIESFIQTDAAINPGNSGGALINTSGELVGINTAILSRTGSYAGYGFAVPVDLVNKVVTDIIEYGEVQKAFIGAGVIDLDSEVIKNLDLKVDASLRGGVVINQIQNDGAAKKAGLKESDIIIEIDGQEIYTKSDFEEIIGYHSPGNIIGLTIIRNQKSLSKKVTLTNREGTTTILKREVYASEYLGADLETVSKVERDMLEIDYGVKILKVYDRGLLSELGLNAGFIVTEINYKNIKSPEDLSETLSNYRGRVRMVGLDATGRKGYYTFYLR